MPVSKVTTRDLEERVKEYRETHEVFSDAEKTKKQIAKELISMREELGITGEFFTPSVNPGKLYKFVLNPGKVGADKIDRLLLLKHGVRSDVIAACTVPGEPGVPYVEVKEVNDSEGKKR